MTGDTARGPIRLALNLADAALADRLATLLANVPGLRLARGNETADAVVVLPTNGSPLADRDVPLTPREQEVLALLVEGASNKMIARRLGISESTVRTHLENIYERLQVSSRTAAVNRAFADRIA